MKHLNLFEQFKKKEKIEYTGKKETYRLKDIHYSKNGDLVGTCKDCGKTVNLEDQEHFPCKKD
jgi:Fe2+ or Zn2+ uptake regulation protein